ncbi:hypothetical protein NNC19_00735 [Clostridium sp. SHJSY1]|uniref:hypothetical protein n=1 Tax=Clostridium sp. SHJSY1 TaxID=2942483 RepID=UPI002876EA6A|nr:hypothetical protein [Clostridium sp. SHJSY1]MDS0524181.1 hypothetical protein [Clostridium sp. SHJSY1]
MPIEPTILNSVLSIVILFFIIGGISVIEKFTSKNKELNKKSDTILNIISNLLEDNQQ